MGESGGPPRLLVAKGVSGREWSLKMVKSLSPAMSMSASSLVVVEDTLSKRTLCAKRQFADSEDQLNKLLKEAAVWRKISMSAKEAEEESPGCVEMSLDEEGNVWPVTVLRLVDCLLFGGQPSSIVFLTEYVPSPSLPRGAPETTLLSILRDVCEALILLYSSGFKPHGGIEMDHVLYGQDKRAKLAGFGLTRSRTLGAKSGEKISEQDDLYALGLIVYELQFDELPPQHLLTRSAKFEVPPKQNCPPAVYTLLRMLLDSSGKYNVTVDSLRYEVAVARGLLPASVQPVMAPSRRQEKHERRLAQELSADDPATHSHSKTENRGEASRKSAAADERKLPLTSAEAEVQSALDSSRPSVRPERPSSGANGNVRPTRPKVKEPSEMRVGVENNVAPKVIVPAKTSSAGDARVSFVPSRGLAVLHSLSEKLKSKRKESASVEQLVNKVIDPSTSGLNAKYVRYNVVEAHESSTYASDLFNILYKKPVQKSKPLAFKTIALLHRLLLEGPAAFCREAAERVEFLSWLGSGRPKEKITPSKPDPLEKNFERDEIALYADVVCSKVAFWSKFHEMFLPNWSRTTFSVGHDPVDQMRADILTEIGDLLLRASKAVEVFLRDATVFETKLAALPTIVTEVTAAYTAACMLVEGAPASERVTLHSLFIFCHQSAREALERIHSHDEARAQFQDEVLMRLPSELGAEDGVERQNHVSSEVRTPSDVDDKTSARGAVEETSETTVSARNLPPRGPSRATVVPTRASKAESMPQKSRSPEQMSPELNDTANSLSIPRRRNAVPPLPPRRDKRTSLDVPSAARAARGDPLASDGAEPTGRDFAQPRPHSLDYGRRVDHAESTHGGSARQTYYDGRRRDSSPPNDERYRHWRPEGDRRRDHHYDYDRDEHYRRGHRHSMPVSVDESRSASDASTEYTSSGSETDSEGSPSRRPRNGSRGKSRRHRRSKRDHRRKSKATSSSESEEESSHQRHKSKSKHEKEKKKRTDRAKKSSRKVHSESEVSHVNSTPIRDLRELRVKPEYDIYPGEIVYGEMIGQGGFGSVYKGMFRGGVVAIKKAHASALSNAKSIEEFQREVAVLCALKHPNILQFKGACTRPPNLLIVTEFMARGTLFDYLHKQHKSLSWKLYRKMSIDLCQGMMYLHSSNLLHRDLKSSNLMLGDDFAVKVGDFGLTRVQQSLGPMTGQCGTFQYMAPEVLGSMPYTEKADIFSFGIILWEMAAKQLPYFGMQPMQVGIAVASQGLRPKLSPEWPHPVKMLMQRCWHADPRMRPSFADAREFLLNLKAAE